MSYGTHITLDTPFADTVAPSARPSPPRGSGC
jgi:hypothetical protein